MNDAYRRQCEESDRALRIAREAATEAAWRDLFASFTNKQREHLARLLAHKWHIGAVTVRNTQEGRNYTTYIGPDSPDDGTGVKDA